MAINNGQSITYNGLGTFSWTAPSAGNYDVSGSISLPTLSNGGGVSAIVAVVKLNLTTKLTGAAGATGFSVHIPGVVAGDVISVTLSSANSADQGLNVIKTNVTIAETF